MDAVLTSPQLDELGLPLGWENRAGTSNDMGEEETRKFVSGDFSSLGLPALSSMPTRAEAQREARERSSSVLSDWNKLQQILWRHEDVIRKRWAKKTKSQRTSIILKGWPSMSSKHRPDYEALRREGPQLKSRGTKFREAYMWPYINVEDLTETKTLMLFLNARGRHAPYMFAHADYEAMRLGAASCAIMPAFLNLHTMLLDGEVVETYERLVSWDVDEDAMMKAGNCLEKSCISFWNVVITILHDFDSQTISTDAPIKPKPPAITDSEEWPSLSSLAIDAPYRVPAQLDFNRLKALVSAKRTSAEDHIRTLREDDGYFADTLGDWSEHRQEKLLDKNHRQHPNLEKPLIWDRVIGSVMSDGYGNFVIWDIISGQLGYLAALQIKYATALTPQKPLPLEYIKALLTFRYTLSQVQKGPILLLKTGVPASPPMRSLFIRELHTPGSSIIRVQSKMNQGSDYMIWLFSSLWTDNQVFLLGLPGLMDEIEYLAQSDPKEKARLSAWVARVLSDLALVARLQHELGRYLPWAAGFDHEYVNHKEAIEKDFPRRFASLVEVEGKLKDISLASLGTPITGRFHYPSDKRRTKQNTESMIKAEQNLDLFWEKVDEHYRRKSGKSIDEALRQLFREDLQLERTPEWTEPVQNKHKSTPAKTHDLGQEPFSAAWPESATTSKFIPAQPKIKPKTRGQASEGEETTAAPPVVEQDEQPTFKLKNRAFKVFKALFFNPAESNLPGEISWEDFLHAMSTTGFAPEKLYGSVWQFTPSTLDVERSIQFHEPHPVGKIPFSNARRIGRRLNRAYEWHRVMFALE